MRGQPESSATPPEDGHQAPHRHRSSFEGDPQDDVEMATQADVATARHATEHHAPDLRHDTNDWQRGTSPIPDMSRWAGILASSSTAMAWED